MTHQGIVVLYNQAKGWGFIKEDSGEEWFFHTSNTAPSFVPQLKARVEFEIGQPLSIGKKDQAVNVRGVQS
jgi:cold shock CspA family protein